jgi:hypothetical protein
MRPAEIQKTFAGLVREALPERARGKPIEVWFQDEARVGQQGTLARIWARRGSRPRAPRDRRYAWTYLSGAVCPERAVGAGLVLPYANIEAWACTSPRSAARSPPAPTPWSCSTGRDGTAPRPSELPGTSPSCRPLPRHSPELNPVESVWEYLRQNYLGLPACLARLRRHRRDLLHRLECPHAGAGPDRLYHPPRLG